MASVEPPDNELLARLEGHVRAALSLVPVQLAAREPLQEPGMPVLSAYFPVTSVVSLISTMESGASADVALIGREGMVGLAGMLGTVESPTTALVQVPGLAFKTTTAIVRAARMRYPSLRAALDQYTEARFIQVAQTAACNRLHAVEARLARLLLEIDDRIDGGRFMLSQEFIAQMLGVQRPTVSIVMHRFAEIQALSYRRRAIVIIDRSKLERLSCECHHILRRAFNRLRHSSQRAVGGEPVLDPLSRDAGDESPAGFETMREIAGRLLVANIREHEARIEAETANRGKEHFLQMLSHELRTPLNAILDCCSRSSESDQDAIERAVQAIQRHAAAQLKLVDDLLDAVTITSSDVAIHPETISLANLVRGAVDAVKDAADAKGVALDIDNPPDLPPISADPIRMRQALINVISNAVKFTDAGGVVTVLATAGNDAAHIEVRDTGPGIAAEDLPHVFERFRQGSPSVAGAPGFGLGLTIAKVLIELHGGSIRIDNGESRGSTCAIELPLRQRAAGAAAASERRRRMTTERRSR
jgi:signal transduction histidine kinase